MARQEEIRSDFESLAEGKGASGPVAQNVGVVPPVPTSKKTVGLISLMRSNIDLSGSFLEDVAPGGMTLGERCAMAPTEPGMCEVCNMCNSRMGLQSTCLKLHRMDLP